MDKYKWTISIGLGLVVSFILSIVPLGIFFFFQGVMFQMIFFTALGLGCGWGAHMIMHHYLFTDRQQVTWSSIITVIAIPSLSLLNLFYIELDKAFDRVSTELAMGMPDIVMIEIGLCTIIAFIFLFVLAFHSYAFRLEDKSILRIYMWAIPIWICVFIIGWIAMYFTADHIVTQGMSEIFTFT